MKRNLQFTLAGSSPPRIWFYYKLLFQRKMVFIPAWSSTGLTSQWWFSCPYAYYSFFGNSLPSCGASSCSVELATISCAKENGRPYPAGKGDPRVRDHGLDLPEGQIILRYLHGKCIMQDSLDVYPAPGK